MKRLIAALLLMACANIFGATVSLSFTNIVGSPDTNLVKIIPIGDPILANGGVITRGPSIRVQPDNTGNASISLMQGNYIFTNAYLGIGIVCAVPQSSQTFSMWQLAISGFNTYNYTPGVNLITSQNGSVGVTYLAHGVTDLGVTLANAVLAGIATNAINSTNFWGLLSPTNLPAGLSSSNYVGTFTGNASGLTNIVAPTAGIATNGPSSGFFSTSQTNSGNIQTASENVTGTITAAAFSGPLNGTASLATLAIGATNDDLGNKISSQFANGTNNTLLSSISATNQSLKIGLNDTNQTWLIGSNATNDDQLFGLNGTNQSWLIGANATNQSWFIGQNATNEALLIGLNGTNQSWSIGLNGTNESLLIGANGTNQSWFIGANGTNESLLIGANGTNQSWFIGANGTNQSWLIGANGTNESLLIGVNGTNQSWLIGLNGTNQSWLIGANGTNESLLIGLGATNEALRQATAITNGAVNNLSNYVATISANATNEAALVVGVGATNEALRQATSVTNGAINNLSNLVATISQNATNQSLKFINQNSGNGTNTLIYGDQYATNALIATKGGIIESNNLGSVIMAGGNITNSGIITVGFGGAVVAATGSPLILGGSSSISSGSSAVLLAPNTMTASSGIQIGAQFNPTDNQSGSASFQGVNIYPIITSSGSGTVDALTLGPSIAPYWRVDNNGNQTNSGVVKASAFYGPLHNNADTATLATSATYATIATNLVSGATTTNQSIQLLNTGVHQVLYPTGGGIAMSENTNGAFTVNDTLGDTVIAYSGAPYASESLVLGLHRGTALAADTVSTRLGDQAGATQVTVTSTSTTVNNPLIGASSIAGKLLVTSKTANYSVLSTDTGTYFNNNGAVGAVTNTLPAATAGLHYSLAVVANFNTAFKGNGSDTIRSVGTVSAAGGLVFSSTVGSTLHLYCPAAGGWWIDSTNGTWTIQ